MKVFTAVLAILVVAGIVALFFVTFENDLHLVKCQYKQLNADGSETIVSETTIVRYDDLDELVSYEINKQALRSARQDSTTLVRIRVGDATRREPSHKPGFKELIGENWEEVWPQKQSR